MISACLCSIARKSEVRPSASRAAKSAPASRRSRATSVRPRSAARCSAVSLGIVLEMDVRTSVQEQPDNSIVSGIGRVHQGRQPGFVGGIDDDLFALRQQLPDRLGLSRRCPIPEILVRVLNGCRRGNR